MDLTQMFSPVSENMSMTEEIAEEVLRVEESEEENKEEKCKEIAQKLCAYISEKSVIAKSIFRFSILIACFAPFAA